MSDEHERVTMLWPINFKARVRDEVGGRGLTAFVIEAVEEKLTGVQKIADLQRQLDETKFFAQQLADIVVRDSPYEGAFEALQNLAGLPDWLDTTGWPERIARLVPEEPEPTPAPQTDVRAAALLGSIPGLVRASEVEPPPAHEELERCLTCNEPLVEGECWICP